MNEYVEVIKQRNRMCECNRKIANCEKCGLHEFYNGTGFGCMEILYKKPEKAEAIIMKWAEENPAKTNYDKLVEIFGDRFFKPEGCEMLKCIAKGKGCIGCPHYRFWQSEYKGVSEND